MLRRPHARAHAHTPACFLLCAVIGAAPVRTEGASDRLSRAHLGNETASPKHHGVAQRRVNGHWVPIPLIGLGSGGDYESQLAAGKVPLNRGALLASLSRPPTDGARASRHNARTRVSSNAVEEAS